MKIVHFVLLLMLMPAIHAQEATKPAPSESPDAELPGDGTQQFKAVPLKFIDVIEADKMLRALKLVDDEELFCQPDARTNQLILRGTAQRISEVLIVLKKIDGETTPPTLDTVLARSELIELQVRQLQLRQLQQVLSPNHPKLKMLEREIEAMEARAKMVRDVADQLNRPQKSTTPVPASIEAAVLKLRPDLNVEIEKVVGGVIQIRGKREDIDTFSQLVESIRVLVSDSSVEQLQDEYEQTEKQVEALADRVRAIENDDELREQQQTELRRLVRRMFSLRMTIQQSQLDEAQADLNASQARLERRQLLAERIIARRVEDLVSGEAADSSESVPEK